MASSSVFKLWLRVALLFLNFRYYLEFNSGVDVTVEFNIGGVFADDLDRLSDEDEFAVDFMAELGELFSYACGVDRAVDVAVFGSLGRDGELDAFESLGGFLGIGFELGDLVGALAEVFLKLLDGGVGSDDAFALRDEIVAAIAVFHLNHFVLVAESGHILLKYDFHCVRDIWGLKVIRIISSGRSRRGAEPDGVRVLRPEPRGAGISGLCR